MISMGYHVQVKGDFSMVRASVVHYYCSFPDYITLTVTYEAANHNQLWDDTLFMTCLPLARASILFNHPAYMQLAIAQFLLHAQYLCDTRTGLWFHGWQFEKIQGRNGHNFAEARWARGNCWITLALPMLLELMDEAAVREDGARTYLITVWRRQVNALLRLQNADNGMWHTILDDSTSYVETSATAGFVAGIFMGIRLVSQSDCFLHLPLIDGGVTGVGRRDFKDRVREFSIKRATCYHRSGQSNWGGIQRVFWYPHGPHAGVLQKHSPYGDAIWSGISNTCFS